MTKKTEFAYKNSKIILKSFDVLNYGLKPLKSPKTYLIDKQTFFVVFGPTLFYLDPSIVTSN